jgi:hypothetical protein
MTFLVLSDRYFMRDRRFTIRNSELIPRLILAIPVSIYETVKAALKILKLI